VLCYEIWSAQNGSPTFAKEENLMIAEICAEPAHYAGRMVTLRGLFQDWRVTQCQFPERAASHPRTRSDWLIGDGTYCVYVTGGMPEDFDLMNPKSLGWRIELEAMVMRDEDGKIYLEYRNSRRL
jgi:hypothetical protein